MHHHPGSAAAPGWSTFFLAFCYQVVYFFSSVSFLSGLVFFKRRWSGFFPALAYFFLDVCKTGEPDEGIQLLVFFGRKTEAEILTSPAVMPIHILS